MGRQVSTHQRRTLPRTRRPEAVGRACTEAPEGGYRSVSSARSGRPWPKAAAAVLHATTGAGKTAPPARTQWVTPMRALPDLTSACTLSLRTGASPSAAHVQQARRLPKLLGSTTESITLQLTKADAAEQLATCISQLMATRLRPLARARQRPPAAGLRSKAPARRGIVGPVDGAQRGWTPRLPSRPSAAGRCRSVRARRCGAAEK